MAPDQPPDLLASAQSQASVFRLLTWKATIPLEIQIARESVPGLGKDNVADDQREDDAEGEEDDDLPRYYMQVPRHTYLPLLLPELEQVFLPSVIQADEVDPSASKHEGAQSRGYRTEDWWFEVEWQGRSGRRREVCKWHWSLDMIQLHTTINMTSDISAQSKPSRHPPTTPLRLLLHLKPQSSATGTSAPPPLSNSIDTCRIAYISLLKEADYIRWGNTRRITGLRRADLESGWNGILEDNYESHSRFVNKIVPLPLPARSGSSTPNQAPENLGVSGPDSCFAVRSIPLKLYLPDNAPEVQDIVNPVNAQGTPTTVSQMLHQTLPRLFPHAEPSDAVYALATPFLYGVTVPPEAEVAWMAACVAAPDGWLRIGIRLG